MNLTPMPSKPFLIVGAVALAGIVAGAVSGAREPTPTPATSPVAATAFDERFDAPDDFPLLKKMDRLPLPAPTPFKTEIVMVQPAAQIDATPKEEPKKPDKPEKPTKFASAEQNLCTRHNMHKVWVTSRRWRCRR